MRSGSGNAAYFYAGSTGHGLYSIANGSQGSAGVFVSSSVSPNISPTIVGYNVSNPAPVLRIRNDAGFNEALGIDINMKTTGFVSPSAINIDMDPTTYGIGINIAQRGGGRSIFAQNLNPTSTITTAWFEHIGSAGRVIVAQNTNNLNTQPVCDFYQASTGTFTGTYQYATAITAKSIGIRAGVFSTFASASNAVALQGTHFGNVGNFDGIGVMGDFAPNPNYGYGVVGRGNWYGVYSIGNMGASGFKPFMIDHPLDPEHQYLRHFAIESPEVLNLYRGTITLDGNGEATVQLPNYFHAINIDFSYQLTAVGTAAVVFVAQEIDANGAFKIAGGNAGQKICWNVYADRNDKFVQQNPESLKVESAKKADDDGLYLQPELWGQPKEKGIFDRYRTDVAKSTLDSDLQPRSEVPADIKPVEVSRKGK